MPVISIAVPSESVLIRADRRLSFELLSAFRSLRSNPVRSIRVLERDDDNNRVLAEFSSPVHLPFGKTLTLRTIESVKFFEPERIEFVLPKPSWTFAVLEDRFTLEDVEGWTRLRYESRFALPGWIFGWVVGKLVVQRMVKQHMREHLAELREKIETRAKRSRVYRFPQDIPLELRHEQVGIASL
ncbi:MAG: SRPBCC family protein [Sphaerobacteraceae bacterium]|nr:MAG: SRPBCC family protein [Sphaerobacteraceae bacterium]